MMGSRDENLSRPFLTAIAVVSLATVSVLSQAQNIPEDGSVQFLTSWGEPNLQGVWDFRTITPLERPDEYEGQEVFTNQQVADFEEQVAEKNRDKPPAEGETGSYNQFWFDRGTRVTGDKRTSLIVDPPDGKIPSLKPAVTKGMDVDSVSSESEVGSRPVRFAVGGVGADGPEDRGWSERCILGFNAGPPMVPSAYNNHVQLFQVPGYVVILNEMVHDARIVPLDGRSHLPEHIRQWKGDSRGYWDGDTLVVDTTNFTANTASFNPSLVSSIGSGETLHLTERFTRVDEGTLLYEFTVDDPTTFTREFTAVVPMTQSDEPVFEYACHEGNHGMFNILSVARAAERQ